MGDPDGRRPITAQDLRASLQAGGSVTHVLERLFAAPLTAERVRERLVAPDDARRRLLCLDEAEVLCLRRSRLYARCQPVLLATLWYVPARLPRALVAELRATKHPFGRIMGGLALRRVLLDRSLGTPGARLALRQRALLLTPQGLPVAEVVERFCSHVLAGGIESLQK